MHYEDQLCVIQIPKKYPMPTTVYGQESDMLYILCGATLIAFREDFLVYFTYEIQPISFRIGGAKNPRLFLNAHNPRIFFSHDLPEECRSMKTERERECLYGQLDKTHKNVQSAKPSDFRNCSFQSRFATEYEVIGFLGSGGFGCVFEAVNKADQCAYAVKRIPVLPESVDEALKEAQILAKCEHDGIVGYKNTWVEKPPAELQYAVDAKLFDDLQKIGKIKPEHVPLLPYRQRCFFIFIQMKLCSESLANWLERNNMASEEPMYKEFKYRRLKKLKKIFKELVEALEYLHDKIKIIHRDLKPGNILFDENGRVKICDMGIIVERKMVDGKEQSTYHNQSGTDFYRSPEQGGLFPKLNSKCDIFTLGLIFAEMFVVLDTKTKLTIFDNYRAGSGNDIFGKFHDAAAFVDLLVNLDPSRRPSCSDILKDPYLA